MKEVRWGGFSEEGLGLTRIIYHGIKDAFIEFPALSVFQPFNDLFETRTFTIHQDSHTINLR